MRPTRIVLYGNFGAGNLGNEVTLQTAIEHTLAHLPRATLLCVCTNPQDVRARHGIEAFPSLSRDPGWSWSDLDAPVTDGTCLDRRRHGLGGALARPIRIAFLRAPRELAHWYKMLRLLARSDVLLVPGTGIITDSSGSLGWPYEMFKLTVLARLCGRRVIFLSVGAGPFHHRLGRWFIRLTLRLAHYRSYRDLDSKRRLENIRFNTAHDLVYPDLAFGLSREHLGESRAGADSPRIVALGLKDYATLVNDADAKTYSDYLGVMADFVVSLQTQGRVVRLIIGDAQYDTRVREDLITVLETRGSVVAPPHLLSEPIPTVTELLRQLREADVVISPRFHNLVLALMLNKPVMALSDLPKVTALLVDLGLDRYCLSLEGLKSSELTGRFAELESKAGTLKGYIREAVERYRRAVEEQYGTVYGEIAGPKRRG
jgi:polysaccharide pyruvyl transferase WcaK-like protein